MEDSAEEARLLHTSVHVISYHIISYHVKIIVIGGGPPLVDAEIVDGRPFKGRLAARPVRGREMPSEREGNAQ